MELQFIVLFLSYQIVLGQGDTWHTRSKRSAGKTEVIMRQICTFSFVQFRNAGLRHALYVFCKSSGPDGVEEFF